jgi:tetratricopeptide (TPR) repeat protein
MCTKKQVILVLLVALIGTTLSAQQISITQLRSLELNEMGSDATYSPFGSYLAVITRSNRVRVYNADYDELWSYRGMAEHGPGAAVAFTPDEERVVFPGWGSGSTIALANTTDGALVTTLTGHANQIRLLALSDDGKWLISTAREGETIVWRRDGQSYALHQRLERSELQANSIAFSPDCDAFALGTQRDFVELYRLDQSERFVLETELHPNQYYGNTGYLFGLAFSPDGQWLAAGLRDELTIWSCADYQHDPVIIGDVEEGYCYSLQFTSDSRYLIGGFQGSRIGIWRPSDGPWVHEMTTSDRQDYVWDLAVAPDGSHLASVSTTRNGVAIWELDGVEAGTLVQVGRMLVSASDEGTQPDGPGESAPGAAIRSILTPALARQLLAGIDQELLAPKSMFETSDAYRERLGRAATMLLRAIQDDLVSHYCGTMAADRSSISMPIDEQGTYDIDAQRYTTRVMGVDAALAIGPGAAESLYVNWQQATVEGTARGGASSFADYELVHPQNGERYALVLGEDPLSGVRFGPEVIYSRPVQLTRDLVLENLQIDPVFPALYRAYESYPVGRAVLRNSGDAPVEGLSATASLARYSSEPAEMSAPRQIAAGDRTDVSVFLLLDEAIVESGGEETISIELAVRYRVAGEQRAGSMTTLVSVLNRNAIRWDDDEKVGAFMTVVQSPTVMSLSGRVAAETAEMTAAALPRELLIAMRVFEELAARRIAYRVDPASSYTELSQTEGAIDFLQFPAETLYYAAGDCDDLSVLYNAIMEGAGIRTAFITTPGHIFTAFRIQRSPATLGATFPDESEFIIHRDEVWVPVETTALGEGFRAAWRAGARQWRAAEANRTANLFTTEEAWSVYPPVPWEPEVTSPEARGASGEFAAELDAYVSETVDALIAARGVANPSNPREHNVRGTIYARFGLLDQAEADFTTAVESAQYLPAMVNLASVAALKGDHGRARQLLEQADELSPDNPRILLGLAVQHLEDGERGSARGYFDRAAALNPALATSYPLFGGGSAEEGRAAEADASTTFLQEVWEE